MVLTEQQATCARSEPRHVHDAANDGFRAARRGRASQGGAQPAEAAVLGARVQRAAVLNIQQPPQAPARKVGAGVQGELPQVRRRIYANDSEERPPPARQMQEEGVRLRRTRKRRDGGRRERVVSKASSTIPLQHSRRSFPT